MKNNAAKKLKALGDNLLRLAKELEKLNRENKYGTRFIQYNVK